VLTMSYGCLCGAKYEQHLAVCPACGRSGQYLPLVDTPALPSLYPSPVLSATDLRMLANRHRKLAGAWAEIGASWVTPFMVVLFGPPASYKTTRALRMADDWPGRALFVSLEMGLGALLADYVDRLEITKTAFCFPSSWQELVTQAEPYDLVVIDSMQRLSATPISLRGEFVDKGRRSVVITSQVNAAGEVAGGMAASHVADVSVRCIDRDHVEVEKNRFVGGGQHG